MRIESIHRVSWQFIQVMDEYVARRSGNSLYSANFCTNSLWTQNISIFIIKKCYRIICKYLYHKCASSTIRNTDIRIKVHCSVARRKPDEKDDQITSGTVEGMYTIADKDPTIATDIHVCINMMKTV